MQFKKYTKQRNGSIQGLRSFKDTLPKNIKRVINKKGHIYSETLSNWKYIVGENLFKVCFPKSFKNSNKFGVSTLLVMVQRGHEVELEYSKKEIMDRSDEEIIKDIKSVLEKNVKDNVAMHGGMINFLSYDKGIVRLEMAGACSGCAMSKQTLHEGVERMLKHYVPEVTQLIGEDDEQAAQKGYSPWAT